MDIKDLRYFVAVSNTLNITKAARQLFISRQALSKSIRELEKKCGTDLFIRDKSRLELTPFGKNMLKKAIPLVQGFNEFEEYIDQQSKNKKIRIRIAIGLGTLNALSPKLFVDFKRNYPEIELIFEEIFDTDVKRMIESQEVEIGLLGSSPEKIEDYDYDLIQEGQIYFQISKDNPLANLEYLVPADLHKQPFVSLGDVCDMHSLFMEKCHEVHSYPDFFLVTHDSNVANNMVANNLAVSFCHIQTINSVANPSIRVLPLHLENTTWGTYVIKKKGVVPTPEARLLIDYLVEKANLSICS
ncbi:MAG: LysR family transcriptional regulator [Desulfitobacterium sp.]|nr:LysR family transcriptional regulator [Desulfitobacterium sp.]